MTSDLLDSELEIVRAALDRLLPDVPDPHARRLREADWSGAVVAEGGQFHRVAVLPGVAVLRMTRSHEAGTAPGTPWAPERAPAAHLPRRMALLAGLGAVLTEQGVDWSLPTPLSATVPLPHRGAAVLQRFVPGVPHPPREGDPAVLRGLLADLAAVDVADPRIAPHLGAPFAYRGPWTAGRVERVAGLAAQVGARLGSWPGDDVDPVVDAAGWPGMVETLAGAVTRWAEEPPERPELVHGDLAGENVRWLPAPDEGPSGEAGWRVGGVIDWDLAWAGDPAVNAAYLALWHGEGLLPELTDDPDRAARARVWLGAMALESLDDALSREAGPEALPAKSWRRLLRKTLPRMARAAASYR